MILPDFEQLGLTPLEGKVYLTLLELGGGYVSTVARRSKIPRVNCYHILENLSKKALVSFATKDNIRYYSAEPPQKLVNMLEEKTEYAKSLLPELLSITNALTLKPKIKYFEGEEGVKHIFDSTLQASKEILGYSNLKALQEQFDPSFLSFYAKKKMEKGIKTRLISPSTEPALKYRKNIYPKDFPDNLLEILFVNPTEFWFEHEISIYDNTVAILSLNENERIGIVIESPVYARSQSAIFNLAWLGASSFIAI